MSKSDEIEVSRPQRKGFLMSNQSSVPGWDSVFMVDDQRRFCVLASFHFLTLKPRRKPTHDILYSYS
jgi:hypothetical protein